MKHFSHFVKRGARYLKLKGEYSSASVAFKNPDGSKVLVVANPYDKEIIITFENKSYSLPPRSINTVF
jgi:glucosylceramidase